MAFGLSRGKNGGKYLNGITSGKNIPRPTTGWMYKTFVNNGEKLPKYQLVGPRQISGSHQQEIHPNFQLPSMELLLMATRNPVRENQLFPLFMTILYIQPTINSMGGVRAPMVSTGKIFGRRTFGGCRSLLGAACRQS